MELKKLRSQVEPQAFEKIEPVLLKELGAGIHAFFEDFEPVPAAADHLAKYIKPAFWSRINGSPLRYSEQIFIKQFPRTWRLLVGLLVNFMRAWKKRALIIYPAY